MREYAHRRPRGLARWQPQAKSRALVEQVTAVLVEYQEFLPLTIRQIFYRLVGAFGYEKSEQGYERLCETLNRARRAELISFGDIRDDGAVAKAPLEFSGLPELSATWRGDAHRYRRERLAGQPRHLELWVEAAGMVPQLARVAHEFGITVYSSGGFDSLTVKHDAAERMLERDVPTLVLHVGDHDPSGLSIFDSAGEDIAALVEGLRGDQEPEFRRVAVTEEQIAFYGLPESPAKKTDKRGDWLGGTVQAEALSPADLAEQVRGAIETEIDRKVLGDLLAVERAERDQALDWVSER